MTTANDGCSGGVNVKWRPEVLSGDEEEPRQAVEDGGPESVEDNNSYDFPSVYHPWKKKGETWDAAVVDAEKQMIEIFGSEYLRLCGEDSQPSDES